MFASYPSQIDVSISDRSQKFIDEINLYAHKNTITLAKKLQKQVAAKFGLRSVAEVRKNGVIKLHDGRLFAWNNNSNFYELEDMKQAPTGSKEALTPFTLLETATALNEPTKQSIQETLTRLQK